MAKKNSKKASETTTATSTPETGTKMNAYRRMKLKFLTSPNLRIRALTPAEVADLKAATGKSQLAKIVAKAVELAVGAGHGIGNVNKGMIEKVVAQVHPEQAAKEAAAAAPVAEEAATPEEAATQTETEPASAELVTA